MGQRTRNDRAGTLHHVTSRGVAQRIIFRDRRDFRYFQSCVAREVHRGTIELLCFCLMGNHFHLLVMSLTGELSEVMQRILARYVKYFNRRYKRDGPLFRSRFFSKPVKDHAYLKAVVRYIDRNATQARLAPAPWDYPWGSAASYRNGTCPIWLRSTVIPEMVASAVGAAEFSGAAYEAFYGKSQHADVAALVESRMAKKTGGPEEADDMVNAAPEQVRQWMLRKAKLADGLFLGDPVCSPLTALEAVKQRVTEVDDRETPWNGKKSLPSDALKTGVLRLVAGCRWKEISALIGKPESTCRRLARRHVELMDADEEYLRLAGAVVRGILMRGGLA